MRIKEIRFKKPFKILTEKDYGYVQEVMGYFENAAYKFQAKVLSDEERRVKGYAVENMVMQYRRRLYLDLWVCIVRLDWLSTDLSIDNMYKEIYQKRGLWGATLIKERHLYNCTCSYCQPHLPNQPYGRRVDSSKTFGLMLPKDKRRNSWRVFWKIDKSRGLVTYWRWTLPKFWVWYK